MKKMVKLNVWLSTFTGTEYEMPMDWIPKCSNGWELIATVEREVE